MRTPTRDIRCAGCNSLLAKVESGGMTLVRGGLQATINGDFHASLVCYRPRCGKLNVLTIATESPERVA